MSSRGAERRRGAAALALVWACASGCTGGSTPAVSPHSSAAVGATPSAKPTATTATATATPTATSVGDPTHRPEGAWTLVAWTTKRSDISVNQPIARVILGSLTPSCPSGPCNLTLRPGGAGGSYQEPEAPLGVGVKPSTKPVELRWDGHSYVGKAAPRLVSCTPRTGPVVPDGYSTQSEVTLVFVPPSRNTPAGVHGTTTSTNKGTKAGKGKGCTDFVETEAIAGSPSGSIASSTLANATYDASMSSSGSTPKSLAPVGRGYWLGAMAVAGDADAPTITGLTSAVAPLSMVDDGWAGSAPSAPLDCQAIDGSLAKKGADALESFSGLHPLAMTASGAPIYAGVWRLRTNANEVGLKAGCSLTRWEGRLILVPHGSRP
jgi:hypothetical protein